MLAATHAQGAAMTATIHHITHPLIQHKLTLMRQKDRSTNSFRQLLGIRRSVPVDVFSNVALTVFDAHPGNHLAVIV